MTKIETIALKSPSEIKNYKFYDNSYDTQVL